MGNHWPERCERCGDISTLRPAVLLGDVAALLCVRCMREWNNRVRETDLLGRLHVAQEDREYTLRHFNCEEHRLACASVHKLLNTVRRRAVAFVEQGITHNPDHVTPECETQRVPAGLDPVAEQEAHIVVQDTQIDKLIAIVDEDAKKLRLARGTIAQLEKTLRSANKRIATLER